MTIDLKKYGFEMDTDCSNLAKRTPENEIPDNVVIYPMATTERCQRLSRCPIKD